MKVIKRVKTKRVKQKIISRPFGRPNYEINEFDLKRAIVRVPSIPLFSQKKVQKIMLNPFII